MDKYVLRLPRNRNRHGGATSTSHRTIASDKCTDTNSNTTTATKTTGAEFNTSNNIDREIDQQNDDMMCKDNISVTLKHKRTFGSGSSSSSVKKSVSISRTYSTTFMLIIFSY